MPFLIVTSCSSSPRSSCEHVCGHFHTTPRQHSSINSPPNTNPRPPSLPNPAGVEPVCRAWRGAPVSTSPIQSRQNLNQSDSPTQVKAWCGAVGGGGHQRGVKGDGEQQTDGCYVSRRTAPQIAVCVRNWECKGESEKKGWNWGKWR